ncbi:hypothetical protein LB505_003292 [Fusarium chuoi]|nr:hypothetical protein LB505_003292 [Fusarium chuoi]
MTSNAAFKESSKVQLLEFIVADGGWHFQHEQAILDDFLAHIDHPYKAVREAIGRVLSVIYKTRYHESFENNKTRLLRQPASGLTNQRKSSRPLSKTSSNDSRNGDTREHLVSRPRVLIPRAPKPYSCGSIVHYHPTSVLSSCLSSPPPLWKNYYT